MAIFSKIDKKVLIILTILLIVIILAGFMFYRYTFGTATNVQNLTGGAQTEIEI